MAEYKAVDAGQLDADLTLVAEAIRKRAGTSETLAFPEGMAETVRNIPAEGLELPELGDTAGKPTDMAADKVLYDDEGNPVTGTLPVAADGVAVFSTADHEVGGTKGDTTFNVAGVYPGISGDGVIVRPNARLGVRKVPTSLLGNATAADVVKGKTFTSAAGFLAEGTLETGGVHMSVDGETLVITGAVTIENETLIL